MENTNITEESQDVEAEESPDVQEAIELPDTSNMTQDELAIHKRIAGQSDDWKTIKEKDVADYSLRLDPFRIPEAFKAFDQSREFKFRWVERKVSRLDEVRSAPVPHRWWIVNRDTFPTVPADIFDPVLGCVMRNDQMLVFKPFWMFEKRQALVAEMTDAQDRGSIERMGSETRDGVNISGGKKSIDQTHRLTGEISGGDEVFENPDDPDKKHTASDFSDLIDQ